MPRCVHTLALMLVASLYVGAAFAQGAVSDPVRPTDSKSGAEYRSLCLRNGLNCQLTYGESAKAPTPQYEPQTLGPARTPIIDGSAAMFVVIGILIVAIGLWLRFGNGGALLSAVPRELKRKIVAPESWKMQQDAVLSSTAELLDRIAAMPDQRAAMVELLRHCLLHAADISTTQFARSDTERSAFGRLPAQLKDRPLLEELLMETELVHYGGRPLPQAKFTTMLANARLFLNGQAVSRA